MTYDMEEGARQKEERRTQRKMRETTKSTCDEKKLEERVCFTVYTLKRDPRVV